MQAGYQNIINSLDFLRETILRRLNAYFNKETADEFSYPQLRLDEDDAAFNHFFCTTNLPLKNTPLFYWRCRHIFSP
ncbi:MAG: hypothetical protein ABI358_13945, partial [Ginsengibacter sp.]